jgi:hypothetical protein
MSTASTTSVAADLADYFQRIGLPVPEGADLPDADMSTLSRVVLGHAQSIPFENLDTFIGPCGTAPRGRPCPRATTCCSASICLKAPSSSTSDSGF